MHLQVLLIKIITTKGIDHILFSQICCYIIKINFSEVPEVMEEVRSFMTTLLSESKLQNQDMTMIKDDLTLLKISHASLQHTSAGQSYQLKEVRSQLEEQGEKITDIESCLETVKESTADHPCDAIEDWTKVIDFDMTDPSTTCPEQWVQSFFSLRTCGRPATTTSRTCFSANFPFSTGSMSFRKVRGRVKTYAYGRLNGFSGFINHGQTLLTQAYVSGVSLTAGDEFADHLWTFAAGGEETIFGSISCPCDFSDPSSIPVPDFVGNQYFCEAGVNEYTSDRFLSEDALWDGRNCNPESTCCEYNRPPYFVNDLGKTITTDSIDARICAVASPPQAEGEDGNDILVERIELYIAP